MYIDVHTYMHTRTNIQISGALTVMGDLIQVLFNNENGINSNIDVNTNVSIENSDILIENNPNILENSMSTTENSINITENSTNIMENSTNIMENSMEIENKIENLSTYVNKFSNISEWSALTSRSCVEFLDVIMSILLLSDNDKGENALLSVYIYIYIHSYIHTSYSYINFYVYP
jgi:hypothetical protein